ncbi:MAG TPA: SAM-dependent methyltransferase [Ktedonobacteraceae bacterium]|nr:SAM-dependent methyltransferase [Ktedonobacteraceae bacterium]
MAQDYREQIKRLVLDEASFVRLTAKGKIREGILLWRQVMVRPILLKGERYLQFSYFTERQDITRNYRGAEAEAKLDELLALPFTSIRVQATGEEIVVQIKKNGFPLVHRTTTASKFEPELTHDLSKNMPLPADRPDTFLQAIGVMDEQGKILPSMQDKFSQVNEFLKLLIHTGELERFQKSSSPVNILDCGCGSAYLSLATYHYLRDIRGIPTHLEGVDVNGTLIEKDNIHSEQLGFSDACFCQSSIIDYQPGAHPDIVMALHACDTATDEAIAQGIRWRSRVILCAPCCHHHLNHQLHAVPPFGPVMQHGILKQRMADMLTDTFRALALRIMGYKTDIIEFISPEHTDKNLMIRALKREQVTRERDRYVQEYLDLKRFWSVMPYIETLLGEAFTSLLAERQTAQK